MNHETPVTHHLHSSYVRITSFLINVSANSVFLTVHTNIFMYRYQLLLCIKHCSNNKQSKRLVLARLIHLNAYQMAKQQ